MGKKEVMVEYQYDKVPIKENIKEKQEIPSHYGYGVRHIQLVIIVLSLTVNFIARGHMGVTVVAMTSSSNIKDNIVVLDTNVTTKIHIRRFSGTVNVANNKTTVENLEQVVARNKTDEKAAKATPAESSYRTYNWTKSTQEMVLGSFFVGYGIMTFPIGLVTQRWGGKIPLQLALFVNGVVSILTPWLTNWGGWKAVCACRVMQGLSQAGVYPSVQNLLAKWAPSSERGTLTSYAYTGSTIGTVVAFQLAGFLGASKWGWPSIFWVIGAICLVLFVILTIFGTASPAQHKTISDEEKCFIMGRTDDGIVRRPKTPWKAIILSRPMWGTLSTHVGSGIIFVFFFTQVPSYIHYILGINVKSSGILSSLPYVASFFTSISFGLLSDYITNKKIVSVKNSRRIFNSISQFGIPILLICASFTTSTTVAVACLVMGMGCHMAIHVGWMVNHIDLAPNFSGTLMMLGNVVMNTFNVILPLVVSHVVTDVTNQLQWRIMIFIVATIAVIANIIFLLFLSAETQPWNDIDNIPNETSLEETKLEDIKENQEKQ